VKAFALRGPKRNPASPSARRLEAPHRRPERGNRLIEKGVILGYRAAAWLLWWVPPPISRLVVARGAQLAYLLWPEKRRRSNINFGHVLGLPPDHPKVRRLALESYGHYGRYVVELMRLPRMSHEAIAAAVDQHEFDRIEAIWRDSKAGLIFTVAHIANDEAVAAAVASRGWPLHVVGDDSFYPELFALLSAQRESWGVKVIPWRSLRQIYEVLRRGEMLVLPVDWGFRSDGIPVRLFGAWTTLPSGPATLAAKTGARVLPVAVTRLPSGRFSVSYGDGFDVPSSAPADLIRATQKMADALEANVRDAPEEWYSFKPVWPETAEEAAEVEARWDAAMAGGSLRPARAPATSVPAAPARADGGGRLEAEPS
jgi:lauroyl/myristoyl acyltransferase